MSRWPEPREPMVWEPRFWRKVLIGDGCWLWTGGRAGRSHYGSYWDNGRQVFAHRFAYELLVGPIPDGLVIDHLCRNTLCVRPDHLEPVTYKENFLRGRSQKARARREGRCVAGHEMTDENTYTRPSGHQQCRACIRRWHQAETARRKGTRR